MSHYPLSEKSSQDLRTPSGRAFDSITLDAVLDGRIAMDDLRVTPEALRRQAAIALEAGRRQLADNLLRAAELATVPESFILTVYEALRPGRTTRERLLEVAKQLEQDFQAPLCAALVREAAGS
jgi:propanediol dehydratase small subunit